MANRVDVMISSTARDLPVHREEAKEACLRQGMFPIMMEHLPASDAEAIGASLKMVDDAEIYLGIFAFRYGYVPDASVNPKGISVTEMEYRRAVERGSEVERMIFIMSDDHDLKGSDVEKGEGAQKLEQFKERLKTENIVNFFDSPADLRAKIIDSLSKSRFRVHDPAKAIHPDPDIPAPPNAFIAHPYTLLSPDQLVGRRKELNHLTEWVTDPHSKLHGAKVLSIVAIGGMGKSALTWKWFNEIAPQEIKPLAGRLWWSFYESNATMENFIRDALAYVSGQARAVIAKLNPQEREDRLIRILDQQPYLLALDGLERVLIAYARMDAAYLRDDTYDEATANYVADAIGLPPGAGQSFTGQFRLRKCADPRAGRFLQRLAGVRASRVLISTRLYPAELQQITGHPLPGCAAVFLTGLEDDDAIDLWRRLGVSGTRDHLLELFNRFDNYPLLVRALAGEVARYRRAPGDFDTWLAANPNFTPRLDQLTSEDRKAHVLEHAMRELSEDERAVLRTVAAFRMPAAYTTLTSLLVKTQSTVSNDNKTIQTARFNSEIALDQTLETLENRGLLGWDRAANRYDLHPIVRAVTWDGVNETAQYSMYRAMEEHFTPLANTINENDVETLEDLAPAVELYHLLVRLGRLDDACDLFYERISKAIFYRLSANHQRAELLERLFPDGTEHLPQLTKVSDQAWTLNALALAYHTNGQPGRAAPLYGLQNDLRIQAGDQKNYSIGLCNLGNAQRLAGALRVAETSGRRALIITREREDQVIEAASLQVIGLILIARGTYSAAETSLHRSVQLFHEQDETQSEGMVNAFLADWVLDAGQPERAKVFADRAWELAQVQRYERDLIRAARVQGAAALALGDPIIADSRLHHALTRARAVNLIEEELPILVELAKLIRRTGNSVDAREYLESVLEVAERGPYPMFHADALNVLTQLERDIGNRDAAAEAATRAYELAWCDGVSENRTEYWAYRRGLSHARIHLRALGAPLPSLPPFDPSQHDPLPEVEIDPEG